MLARNHKSGPLRSGRRGPMYPDRADLEETKSESTTRLFYWNKGIFSRVDSENPTGYLLISQIVTEWEKHPLRMVSIY